MRPRISLFGLSRLLSAFLSLTLTGMLPGILTGTSAAQSCTSTVTGKVYSPNGSNGGDPIPNILVFAVDDVALPSFASQGLIGIQNSNCSTASQTLVPPTNYGHATTDAYGNFTFTSSNIPATANIVIQAGKWRRQFFHQAINQCGTTTLPELDMPGSKQTGDASDLPQIAISTGSADAIECIFNQIGIKASEFTQPGGTGSINLYAGSKNPGEANPDSTGLTGTNPTPTETTLMNTSGALNAYDVVIFGCQGAVPTAAASNATSEANLEDFANRGGRIFAGHYGYEWLYNNTDWKGVANWNTTPGTLTEPGFSVAGEGVALIDTTTFDEGKVLADWLHGIGADYNGNYGQMLLQNIKYDQYATYAPAQSWANLNYPGDNNPSMQFTFDTPIGTSGSPTVAMSFSNSNPSPLQGDTGDTVTINVVNNSTTDADASLTFTIAVPAGVIPTAMAGTNAGSPWVCNYANLTCTRTAALPAGSSDPILLTFNIDPNSPVGSASLVAVLSGGNLSGSAQCGRVLYNSYHVEVADTGGTLYPNAAACKTTTLTPQEKFLEFSLYNLSNFVSPITEDDIDIHGPTTLAWPPITTVYYGAPLDQTILDATATDNVTSPVTTVPGTLAYTTSTGTALSSGMVLDAGTYSLSVAFTPNDASAYTSASLTGQSFIVLPDPTTTVLTANPASTPAGQTVTLTAATTDAYYTTQGQTVAFYDGSTVIGAATIDATGTAVYTINTFSLGSHSIKACLVQTQDYLPSCSSLQPESITVPGSTRPTITLLASGLNPSIVGQTVIFTANVSTTDAFNTVPTGTVTFLDGSTVLGTGTLTAGGTTFSTSSLAAGTHNITAAYAGTTTIDASTSSSLAQVVTSALASAGTGFLMTVTPTTFDIGAGSTVNLGVLIQEFNSFNVPVTLSCSGLPAESTCKFGTSTIPIGGGNTTVSVFVAAPHSCSTSTASSSSPTTRGLPILALVTFLFFARRRRAIKGLALSLLLCIIPAVTGCSGNCTDLGVKPTTYSFTITGTATTTGATPVVTVPGDVVSGTTVTQTQAMSMNVTI